jgi:uncharacterized RDD family membrane protein YckC
MHNHSDFLREEYTIETPENVAFGYEVAGIGSRFIGALVDVILLGIALAVLNILAVVGLSRLEPPGPSVAPDDVSEWAVGVAIALYALLNFGLIWGYFIAFELLHNGQTPGKRVAGTRVVRTDGNPAGVLEIVIRNLVRIIDFLPGGYGVGLITMFVNRQARRLGDLAAGTLVIKERSDIKLASLTGDAATLSGMEGERIDAWLAAYPGLRGLTAADFDLVQATLQRASAATTGADLLVRLATVIAGRVGHPPPPTGLEARRFLEDVARVYRRLRIK